MLGLKTVTWEFGQYLQKLSGLVQYAQKAGPYSFPVAFNSNPQWTERNYQNYIDEAYFRNTLVFRCVNLKAQTASMARLAGMRVTATDNEVADELPRNHPLQRLARKPNKYMSYFQWQELSIKYLNLAGNCYFVKDTDLFDENGKITKNRKGSIPAALWPVRPDRIRPVPSLDGELLGYVYDKWGYGGVASQPERRVTLRPEQVIHIKYANPGDIFEGLGEGVPPLLAAARVVDTDNASTGFIKAFFDNSGVISGLIKTKQKLIDTEIERIKQRWREMYGREFGKQWDVAVLDMDTEYQQMGLTFNEMAFQSLDFRDEARICMAFDMHPSVVGTVLGLTRNTYSNPREARRAFWEDTMLPEYKRFQDAWALGAIEGDTDLVLRYDYSEVPALRHGLDEKVKNYVALTRSAVTPNNAAQITGLNIETREGGDTPLITSGIVTLEQILAGDTSSHQGRDRTGKKEPAGEQATSEAETKPPKNERPKQFSSIEYIKEAAVVEASKSTHVMLALYPELEVAQSLAISGGEAAEDLHVTVALLRRPLPRNETPMMTAHTVAMAAYQRVWIWDAGLTAKLQGMGMFDVSEAEGETMYAHYLNVDCPELVDVREKIVDYLWETGYRINTEHGYTPHMTLLYADRPQLLEIPNTYVVFRKMSVVADGERYDIDLNTGEMTQFKTSDNQNGEQKG